MRAYKSVVWQSANNIWEVNDVASCGYGTAGKWYTQARILNLSPVEFVKVLDEKYHAVGFRYVEKTDYLAFHFTNEEDAKKYSKTLNSTAKKRGITVE